MKFTASCALFIIAASAQHNHYGGHFGSVAPIDGGYVTPSGGYDGGRGSQRTYGWKKGIGYGIYNFSAGAKPLIGNDGYKLKKRSDPYSRNYERVWAKCVLNDPDEETYVTGILHMSQAPGEDKTQIRGGIQNANYADISINALGDLTDGCDSAGDVFNPYVSEHGTASYH